MIGLFGGSFDPVHRGHVVIAERARDQVPCDEVWLVPAFVAPHKPHGAHARAEDRLAMLSRATEGRRGLRVETLELDAGRPMRTIETLRILAGRHPGLRWRLLLGEDSWEAIDGWVEAPTLLALAPPVVQARPGSARRAPALATDHPPHWLDGTPVDADSTSVREALARGETPPVLSPAVVDYIRSHRLYGYRASGGPDRASGGPA